MRDVAAAMRQWLDSGRRTALATVVHTWGSSPRQAGSCMLVRDDSVSVGSVSGGCVENAVIIEAMAAIDGGPPKLLEFGQLADANYWDVGLSCGGSIKVWVERPTFECDDADGTAWWDLLAALEASQPCVRVVRMDAEAPAHLVWRPDGSVSGSLADDPRAVDAARHAYARRETGEALDGAVFVHVMPAPDRLIVVGAVHIAIPLVRLAKELGFETVVVDPRAIYATLERFGAEPDALIHAWPEEALEEVGVDADTYAVVLSHDPKIDDPALRCLLRSDAAYIGALGSPGTQASRRERLAADGFQSHELDRIHGPVGLSIGAKTPEEIALAIMAEIVQCKRARIAEASRA